MKKDKNAPKRPCSAYMCFANAKRSEVIAAQPTLAPTEVTQELGRLWREEKQREPYEALALKDKQRYEAEKAAYEPPSVPKKPKRARNAYILFCAEQRPLLLAKQPELSAKDVVRCLGERWNTVKDKTPYEAKAAADKQRYAEDMATYVPPEPAATKGGKKADASPTRKDKKAPTGKNEAKPAKQAKTKRAPTAYDLFSKAERASVKQQLGEAATLGQISTELSKRWKAMLPEQKEAFRNQVIVAV